MIRYLSLLLIILSLSACGAPIVMKPEGPSGAQRTAAQTVVPRIITGSWDTVTKTFPIAIEFTIEKDWHLYWLNPGDAGSPPEVTWKLPVGWTAGALQFPVPKRIEEDGLVSFAYYDKLVLASVISSPIRPSNESIAADIKWVVCKDICVPGRAMLDVNYDRVKSDFDIPRMPLVPTLAEVGIVALPSKFAVSYSDGEGGIMLDFYQNNQQLQIEEFYPLPTDDRPLRVGAARGSLELITRSSTSEPALEAQTFARVNGLVFIRGRAFWLKAP